MNAAPAYFKGPGDFLPIEPTRAEESDATFLANYIDAIPATPESLIAALKTNRELAESICEFIGWANDVHHASAADHFMRIACAVDREIRRSAAEALRLEKSMADEGEDA